MDKKQLYKYYAAIVVVCALVIYLIWPIKWPVKYDTRQRIIIDSLLLLRQDSIIAHKDKIIDSLKTETKKIEIRYETIINNVLTYDKHDIDSFITARYVLHR